MSYIKIQQEIQEEGYDKGCIFLHDTHNAAVTTRDTTPHQQTTQEYDCW